MRTQNNAVGLPPIAAALVALAAVFTAGRLDFAALELHDVSMAQLGELLASFLFLALLIERAVELILNWRFGADEIAILAPFKQAAEHNAFEAKMLERDMDLLVSPQDRMAMVDGGLMRNASVARETLPAQAAATRLKLEELSVLKNGWATWSCMALATGLSLSGFQLLHGGFAAQIGLSDLPTLQMNVLSFVDIFLTAVALAGAAGGIHQVVSRLTDFGQRSKTRILQD
ncbi:hypothetical protein [Roseovarius sp. Pro17]|uniref:hypothetical protein n=1 Tax=Roseovarius sp. Pro17 TaxID=3108175 RepID=UPI002D798C47|nr:hypothetical protein [Roseovarius sp. Pro17]